MIKTSVSLVFRLAQSVCVNVRLELSGCRSINDLWRGSID